MTDDAAARLETFRAELARGNLDCVSTYIAGDFFGYSPGPGEPTATERFSTIAGDLKAAMSDLAVRIDDISREGETFTATATIGGTHDGPLWGGPPTGRRVTWQNAVTIKPVGDAFAVKFEDVSLPAMLGVLRELGLVNPPDEMDRPPDYPVSPPEFLLKVILTGQAADKPCEHLSEIRVTEPSTRVCAACFAAGDRWPALRMCLICGFVGCCDTSKNKHMGRHHEETGHALMRSIRLDEGWIWCYEDNAFFETRTLEAHR